MPIKVSHKKGMGIKAQLARRAAAREALLGISRKKERVVPPPVKRVPMSNSPRRMPPPKMIDGKPSRAGHICPVKGCDGMSHRTGLCVVRRRSLRCCLRFVSSVSPPSFLARCLNVSRASRARAPTYARDRQRGWATH